MSSSRAAIYDDRILEGARAGDLPVERPTKFAMLVNTLGVALVPVEAPAPVNSAWLCICGYGRNVCRVYQGTAEMLTSFSLPSKSLANSGTLTRSW
jgi:hypothetical protein